MTKFKHEPTFRIEGLLPEGKENAISTRALMTYFNCTERELRQMISSERRRGAVICSATTGGYFRPATYSELLEFYRSLKSQADTINAALESTKHALEETEENNEIL